MRKGWGEWKQHQKWLKHHIRWQLNTQTAQGCHQTKLYATPPCSAPGWHWQHQSRRASSQAQGTSHLRGSDVERCWLLHWQRQGQAAAEGSLQTSHLQYFILSLEIKHKMHKFISHGLIASLSIHHRTTCENYKLEFINVEGFLCLIKQADNKGL